jgi:hypothetical protein
MWGWASNRPVRCLKIGTEAVAWAETERNWRGRRRYRCAASPVPVGTVKPSPADQNLADIPALETRIRALAGPSPELRLFGRPVLQDIPRPIVLLLPDAAVRAVVLHLDQLPAKTVEREALIRWRLSQEQLFPLAGAKVVSQVFGAHGDPGSPAQAVLAIAVQESVLAQYESLCESVGLVPHDVGVTSLRLFDLWRKLPNRSTWRDRDLLWINLGDRALTTMIFQHGRLVFYRCKLLTGEPAVSGGLDDATGKIVEECGASLDVCLQRHPTLSIKDAVLCADDGPQALQEQLESSLAISVQPFGWRSLESLGWATRGSHRTVASLSVMAGVV